jgi:D-glycero-D-manno-heptose 1,7-bisphosphate phosphatase
VVRAAAGRLVRLSTSRLRADDLVLAFSVGGGNVEKNVSPNIVGALQYAKRIGARVVGVVGLDGGYTAQVADACVLSAYCQSGSRHAAYRGLSGGCLAFTSLAPGAEVITDKMGVDPVRSAVFLDRDGVITQAIVRHGVPHPPDDVSKCVLLPGVREACQMLWAAGYLLIVVTNQPDVARGLRSHESVEAINAWVQRMLPIHRVLTCYHDNVDRCECRKPKPGLLLQAASCWGIALSRSVMVGDRWSDVEAGWAAGCMSILIEREYSGRERCQLHHIAQDLLSTTHVLLRRKDGV